MSRTYTNEIVIALGFLLLAAAIAFAWFGSRKAPLPSADDAAQRISVDGAGDKFDWETIGQRTYQSTCASCHGEGETTRRVPPLREHAPNIFGADGGRTYLIDFILFGLTGRIQVVDATYEGKHPIYKDRLSDEEIAATLNFILVSWDNRARLDAEAVLYNPQEVAQRRRLEYSREQMLQTRERLFPAQ